MVSLAEFLKTTISAPSADKLGCSPNKSQGSTILLANKIWSNSYIPLPITNALAILMYKAATCWNSNYHPILPQGRQASYAETLSLRQHNGHDRGIILFAKRSTQLQNSTSQMPKVWYGLTGLAFHHCPRHQPSSIGLATIGPIKSDGFEMWLSLFLAPTRLPHHSKHMHLNFGRLLPSTASHTHHEQHKLPSQQTTDLSPPPSSSLSPTTLIRKEIEKRLVPSLRHFLTPQPSIHLPQRGQTHPDPPLWRPQSTALVPTGIYTY